MFSSVSLVDEMMASEPLSAAQRRKGLRLCAALRHEQQSIAMALGDALHHSAGPWKKKVEMQQNAALRGQNTGTRARKEGEKEPRATATDHSSCHGRALRTVVEGGARRGAARPSPRRLVAGDAAVCTAVCVSRVCSCATSR